MLVPCLGESRCTGWLIGVHRLPVSKKKGRKTFACVFGLAGSTGGVSDAVGLVAVCSLTNRQR
jgi:hypothetical protein